MRIIILSLLMLVVVFFIPAEKCNKKYQFMGLFFLAVVFAFTVLKEVYSFGGELSTLLLLDSDRMEGNLSMLAVYIFAICNVVTLMKCIFYEFRKK